VHLKFSCVCSSHNLCASAHVRAQLRGSIDRNIHVCERCFIGFLLPSAFLSFLYKIIMLSCTSIVGCCNCNCKYNNLYSTVGGKPLLGCLTRMFTVSAISNARDYRSSTVSTKPKWPRDATTHAHCPKQGLIIIRLCVNRANRSCLRYHCCRLRHDHR